MNNYTDLYRKRTLLISSGVSILSLIVALPFIGWIKVVNAARLYALLEVDAQVVASLKTWYSLYNILSFVQDTVTGSIGYYAMLLFLLFCASLYFHIRVIFNSLAINKNKNYLKIMQYYSTSFTFNIILYAATIGYMFFANQKFGMRGFALSPTIYVMLAISMLGFIIVQKAKKAEMIILGEKGFLNELKKNWPLFLMLLPVAVYLLINNYLPMSGTYFAFTSFNFRDGLWASPFVGFSNFEYLLRADILKLTKNTVLYNIVFIAIGNVLQIIFAIMLSYIVRKSFKRTLQTLMFMPYFVSYVLLKVFVYNIFEYNTGLVNSALLSLGLDRIDIYNTPAYWPYIITIFYIWKNLGYGMVIYLATITGISDQLYEAARIDGASILQQIKYITLPLIKPTFVILLLFSLGRIMKGQFELFYQLVGTNGTLYNITDIFDTYVYRITTTQPLNIGTGTAAGLYQSLFGFILIMTTNFIVKKTNEDYALF